MIRFQQFRREYQIAHAQRRGNRLRKRVHIQNASVPVRALQRGDRASRKAEFAVVIVLNQIAACLLRPAQKRVTAAYGRHDSGRVVVRGGDMRRRRARTPQGVHAQPVRVQRQTDEPRPATFVNLSDFQMSGVLQREQRGRPQ